MPSRDPAGSLRVENELLRRHRDVLIALAHRASQQLQLDDFLHEVAVEVANAVEIDHVKVLRYRPERGDLFTEAGVGWRPGVVKSASFPTDLTSPPGRSFQTAQPTIIEALAEAREFRIHPVLAEHGIQSLINVAIVVDGAAWGVLEADSSVLRGFGSDTVPFMTACAALCSLVIRRTDAEAAQREAMAQVTMEAQKRGVLLSEMQHRVKNNFQTIVAMILLEARKAKTGETRAMAHSLAEKIRAMSLAHDQLSPTREDEAVELRSYLEALVASIQEPHENVTVQVEAANMAVRIDQAVPIGLIVNEAVTNAVKHAFAKQRAGVVRVILRPGEAGEAHLEIADNGSGMQDDNESGSGHKLLRALAAQVHGRLGVESSADGTRICLNFPHAQALAAAETRQRDKR